MGGGAPRRTFKLAAAAGLHFPACRGAAARSLAQALCDGWEVATGVAAALGPDLTEASLVPLTPAAGRPEPRSFCLRLRPASATGPPLRPRLLKEGPPRPPAGGRFRCPSSRFPFPPATRVTRGGAGAAFVRLRALG